MKILRALLVVFSIAVFSNAAAEIDSAEVTRENLIRHEVYWPYRVTLTAPVSTANLRAGSAGVLIRVEPGGLARVDFGRDGVHTLPIDATDLVAGSNALRLGTASKLGPNLAVAIGPRLADSAAATPRLYGFEAAVHQRAFLLVFVDAQPESLRRMVERLAPLRDRAGVATVVLPRGDVSDLQMRERLRDLGWPVPFVLDHLAEAYTRSLLGEGIDAPAVSLQSAEGRLIFEASASDDLAVRLEEHLDAEFGDASSSVRSAASL